jgi:hypothetical protein
LITHTRTRFSPRPTVPPPGEPCTTIFSSTFEAASAHPSPMFSLLFCFRRPSSRTLLGLRHPPIPPAIHHPPVAETRECIICAELRAPAAFPDAQVTAGCSHAPQTCLDCLSASIRAHVANGFWTDVPCPECPSTMSHAETQRYADAETRQRYDELRLQRMIQNHEDFVWVGLRDPRTPPNLVPVH